MPTPEDILGIGTTPAASPTPQPAVDAHAILGIPKHAVPRQQQTRVETPQGARPNLLRQALDVLDVPYAYAQAIQHKPTETPDAWDVIGPLGAIARNVVHPNAAVQQVTQDLRQGGPGQVAANDLMFRVGHSQRVLQDPNATPAEKQYAQYLLDHPWIAGAGDVAAEFINPANIVTGETLGAVGRAARATPQLEAFTEMGGALSHATSQMARPATAALGAAARTVGSGLLKAGQHAPIPAVREFFDRYAQLRARGGAPFVHAGLAAQAAPEHAESVGSNFIDSLGKGLTREQKIEVQRLSYVDQNGTPMATRNPDIPEPTPQQIYGKLGSRLKKNKTVPTLEERALALRRYMIGRDSIQNVLGLREASESGGLYDPGTFWPMRQFEDNPVYAFQEGAQEKQPLGDIVEATRPEQVGGMGRGGNFSASVGSSKSKVRGPVLTDQDVAELHQEYDPFYQLRKHYARVNRAIANEQQRRGLETLESINPKTGNARVLNQPGSGQSPLMARMPLYYAMQQPEQNLLTVFGYGQTGEQAMRNYIERTAQGLARQKARQDPRVVAAARAAGVSPQTLGTRQVVNANLRPLQQRAAEAAIAQRQAGALAKNVANISRVAQGRLNARAQEMAVREAQAQAAYQAAEAVPKVPIRKGMDADAQAAAEASNRARKQGMAQRPVIQTEAAATEAQRAAETADQSFTRVNAKAAGLSDKASDRVAKLQAQFAQRTAKSIAAQQFQKVAREHYEKLFDTVRQDVESRVEQTLTPPGYVRESTLGIGSPTGRDMALDDSFAKFFKGNQLSFAEDSQQARQWWHTMQTLNRLARASIVMIPTVHAVNNMGMAYLAEGGSPVQMARILAGKAEYSQSLKDRAFASGAATETAQHAFGLAESPHATTAIPERAQMAAQKAGTFAPVVRPVATASMHAGQAYQAMNQWLFKNVEQGYAFDLFDKYTKPVAEGGLGLSDGAAALRVRNTLGRYDNISPKEQQYYLNRIFYFYPWMKTVVPFWVKKGMIDPKWWSSPVAGIRTLNQEQGYDDPSKPFTATIKNLGQGQYLRATAPLPQRVLETVADVARLPFDRTPQEIGQDIKSPANYLTGHLNPFLGVTIQGVDVATHGPTQVAPFNVFHATPGESKNEYIRSLAANLASRVIAPLARTTEFEKDPIGTLGSWISGSFVYTQEGRSLKNRERSVRQLIDSMTHDQMLAAKASGDPAKVQAVNALREQIYARAVQRMLEPKRPQDATNP